MEEQAFCKRPCRQLFHIPLKFGAVTKRNIRAIEAADAKPESMVILADEYSLWGTDVYLEITKNIAGAAMATFSGTFLSKVFDGPYRNVRQWIEEMKTFVGSKGKAVRKLYFFCTTCPKYAKKFGKNYVESWRKFEEGL